MGTAAAEAANRQQQIEAAQYLHFITYVYLWPRNLPDTVAGSLFLSVFLARLGGDGLDVLATGAGDLDAEGAASLAVRFLAIAGAKWFEKEEKEKNQVSLAAID